jgi:hypothetical protein
MRAMAEEEDESYESTDELVEAVEASMAETCEYYAQRE